MKAAGSNEEKDSLKTTAKNVKRVRFFNSFKEQEDEMVRYWASITPAKRLAHLYEMIKVSFRLPKDGTRLTTRSNKITVVKYEP